jgi:hypothetical protein
MKWLSCLWLLGLWGGAAAYSARVTAGPLTEEFQRNSVDASQWMIGMPGTGPSFGQGGGSMAIFFPAHSSGLMFGVFYRHRLQLRGDFDIQVDFRLPLWSAANGVRVGLGDVGGSTLGTVERASWGKNDAAGPPGEGYVTDFVRERKWTFTRTSDAAGRLRMVRSGTTVTGYRWDPARRGWVKLHSGPAPTIDVSFGFGAWSHDQPFGDRNVLVTFSHFKLNRGTLVRTTRRPG